MPERCRLGNFISGIVRIRADRMSLFLSRNDRRITPTARVPGPHQLYGTYATVISTLTTGAGLEFRTGDSATFHGLPFLRERRSPGSNSTLNGRLDCYV
jgi:hypothetical protein